MSCLAALRIAGAGGAAFPKVPDEPHEPEHRQDRADHRPGRENRGQGDTGQQQQRNPAAEDMKSAQQRYGGPHGRLGAEIRRIRRIYLVG